MPQAQTTRECRLMEVCEGKIINAQTKEAFNYNDPYVERGVTLLYHPVAYRKARQDVKEFTAVTLRLR
jgi:hypothetical protein